MTTYLKTSKSSSALLKLPKSPISPLESKTPSLELFQLVWLDPHIHEDVENQTTYKILQENFTYVHTFIECNTCEQWLKNYGDEENIILIVSGAFGKSIIPHIHDLVAIDSIYIYCIERKRYEGLPAKYPKIRDICTAQEDLIQRLTNYRNDLENIENTKSIQIFKNDQSTSSLIMNNTSFLCYQLLLEILISSAYLPVRDTFRQLTDILCQYNTENAYHIASINRFKETYQAKQAVTWLMGDSPIKRFIDKLLREQNIHMLFLVRFLLKDIYFRLSTHPIDSIRVYKLQLMTVEQIEYLKNNRDQYLSFPGFLDTSINRPDLKSIDVNYIHLHMVLLEIDAYHHTNQPSFAYVDEINTSATNQNNKQVLFMCGTIFRISSLKQIDDFKWTFQLKLADEYNLIELVDMKRQLRHNTDLCIIGDLQNKCKQNDKAITYYKCLLEELPSGHAQISKIQEKLRKISELKSTSLNDTQFVVIDLSDRLSDTALAMLDALKQLTNDTILIFDQKFDYDVEQLADKTIFLFTSRQFLASTNWSLQQKSSIFILENDSNKVDQRHRFATGEDLICQLADELYRCYTKEAENHFKSGDIKVAKNKEILANQIHSDIRKAYQKTITVENNTQPFVDKKTEIVWLKAKTQHNTEVDKIQRNLGGIVSSYCFYIAHECQRYLNNKENMSIVFLIIDIDYDESTIALFERLSNIKRLYRYEKSTSLNDLCSQLTYDLIDHYNNLALECRNKNKKDQAREMFAKAKKLCDLLADF